MARKKTPARPQPPRPRPEGCRSAAAGRSPRVKVVVVPKPLKKKNGQHGGAIIESNFKTELCRNWQRGTCIFGERCAFAHGVDDIKHKTLRELEKEGRIPDASKHHCGLCMNWVSTGACRYGRGCAFIHDARAIGPVDATLRLPPNLVKISSTSSRTVALKLLGPEGGDRGPLAFPDIPRDPDSIELPADKVRYDLDPNDSSYADGRNLSTVAKVWYSFLSAMMETNIEIMADTISTDTDTISRSKAAPTPTVPRPDPPSHATTTTASYKDATTRSLAAHQSAAKAAARAASANGAAARVAATRRASSTVAGAEATAAAKGPATPITADNVTTPPVAPKKLGRLDGVLQMKIPRSRDSVKHLPVFESLSKGKSPVRPDTLPLPDTPLALVEGGAAGDADKDVTPSPAPSFCSVYYSPTSSPSAAPAPPSPVGGTATVAAPGVVQLGVEDSYFSCSSSPVLSTKVLKPPPGFEAAYPSTASAGWSCTSTDAASWTSSGSSSEHDDDADHDNDVEENGGFGFFQPLPADPWAPSAAAGEGRASRTTVRLPFFAGLHSDAISNRASTSSNDGPSATIATNGGGGMFYLLLPYGRGGTSRGSSGDYMTAVGSVSDSEYGNGGGFSRLGGVAPAVVAPFKVEYGYPVDRAEYLYNQQSNADAARLNTRNIYATNFF